MPKQSQKTVARSSTCGISNWIIKATGVAVVVIPEQRKELKLPSSTDNTVSTADNPVSDQVSTPLTLNHHTRGHKVPHPAPGTSAICYNAPPFSKSDRTIIHRHSLWRPL